MTYAARTHAAVKIEPDGNGRLWVPAMINGKGPFRLIVDSGANRSAVTAEVARSLGASSDAASSAILHGVTGDSRVPMVEIESMSVGHLSLPLSPLPILREAAAGTDGYLGLAGWATGVVVLDLENRELSIENPGTVDRDADLIPAELSRGGLLMVDVRLAGVVVKAILDTGAQATIGNSVLQRALGAAPPLTARADQIIGAGFEYQPGYTASLPPLTLGTLRVQGARASFGDLPVFEYFGLTKVPALMIGMDIIGRLSSIAIDYTHRVLQVRARAASRWR